MLGYIQTLQRQQAADQIYNQLGWRNNDTELVLGDRCYSKAGMKQVKLASQLANVAKNFVVKGDLEAWKKVANIYNKKGEEEYAFAFMMGFGSLLFKFSGYEGALFNMHGDSGAGKSTILKLIHSIYGIPTEKSVLEKDTVNAKIVIFGAYNNIPITYDEITNIAPEALSDLTYALSNGRGKEALKQDRTLRVNTATWQLLGFSTSNKELIPIIFALKGGASGETYRIMERPVEKRSAVLLNEARVLFGPLDDNYGVAGVVIAEWLVNNLELGKKMIADAYTELCDKVKAQSPERFWCAMGATAIVGTRLGNMLNLHSYNPDWIMNHAVSIILASRGSVSQEIKTPVDILVEYMNLNIMATLVTRKSDKTPLEFYTHMPNRGVVIRHEASYDRAYFDKHAFRDWATTKGHSVTAIFNFLQDSNLMVNKNQPKSLGEGTEFATGRSQCFVIDTAHPLINGKPRIVTTILAQEEAAARVEDEVAI